MNMKSLFRIFLFRALAVIAAAFPFATGVVPALADDNTSRAAAETVFHADILARANPQGFMLIAGGYRRWSGPLDREYGVPSSREQLGMMFGINPAYAQGSAYGEWMPVKFFQVRLQYDGYYYFGANGALLSFPSSSSPFGKDEIKSLKGQEESGWGQRINLQPVLTAKAGKFIIRNLTDIGYYRFDGKGPYFYEWEYDTLLKSGDYLVNNVTGVLYEGWKPGKTAEFLAGPFYQVTHAASADINRQRIGVEAFWSPGKKQGGSWTPRLYGRLGYNLQDRNREDELFAMVGAGADF